MNKIHHKKINEKKYKKKNKQKNNLKKMKSSFKSVCGKIINRSRLK